MGGSKRTGPRPRRNAAEALYGTARVRSSLPVLALRANPAFFFQAKDGIRDPLVTGVQTCALPISAAQRFPGPSQSLQFRNRRGWGQNLALARGQYVSRRKLQNRKVWLIRASCVSSRGAVKKDQ